MLDVRVPWRSKPVPVSSIAVLMGLLLTGCNNGLPPRQPVFPVKGRILANGVPAVHAKIFLVPLGEDRDALRPRATSGSDGTFTISTYEHGDGAPAGEYAVGIAWRGPPRKGEAEPKEDEKDYGKEEGRLDFFKGRYRDAKASGIKIKVESAPTVVPDINLK